jgi:hypothetical protein
MLPISNAHWSQPLKVDEVAVDRNRPPNATGLVYVVSGAAAPDNDVKYLGSAHATDSVDGLERIGLLIGAMLGFELWHSGGIKLHTAYPANQINGFYVLWALIDGCPVLAERELRQWYLNHPANSPDFGLHDGGPPARNRVCRSICIPQNLGWNVKP